MQSIAIEVTPEASFYPSTWFWVRPLEPPGNLGTSLCTFGQPWHRKSFDGQSGGDLGLANPQRTSQSLLEGENDFSGIESFGVPAR